MRTPQERALVAGLADQISDELNVKAVEFLTAPGEVADESVRPVMAVLGAVFGPRTPAVLAAIKARATEERVLGAVRLGQPATVVVEGEAVTLPADALTLQLAGKPGYAVAEQAGYLVALPTALTDELKDEGLARELAHRLNTMRKAAGFDIADWIAIEYVAGAHVARVLHDYDDYVKSEALARTVEPARLSLGPDGAAQKGGRYRETVSVDGEEVTFILRR
jgi:isoleucyl-tRNA synthetase